ncbi:hypothetical protein EJB05_13489, partial [Eragrostis curvula]
MAGEGFITTSSSARDYGGRVTFSLVVTYLMAASCGLIYGYDTGISGGVTQLESFLSKFFPEVLIATKNTKRDNYCKYDNQWLTTFTSSLYITATYTVFTCCESGHEDGWSPENYAFRWCIVPYRCYHQCRCHKHCHAYHRAYAAWFRLRDTASRPKRAPRVPFQCDDVTVTTNGKALNNRVSKHPLNRYNKMDQKLLKRDEDE